MTQFGLVRILQNCVVLLTVDSRAPTGEGAHFFLTLIRRNKKRKHAARHFTEKTKAGIVSEDFPVLENLTDLPSPGTGDSFH